MNATQPEAQGNRGALSSKETAHSAEAHADRLGSALPSQVRHDLRTHLNQILGYSELLMDDAQDGGWQEAIPDLQNIYMAGRNLLTIINDYVDPVKAQDEPMTHLRRRDATAGKAHRLEKNAAPAYGSLLVVDDNAPNREMLVRSLQRQGYTVSVAADGRQALEMVRAQPFDLILLDIMLPEMDGYEVLQHLKSDPALWPIPVLMISVLDDMESVVHCIQAGAEDYLPKPFNSVLLKARIDACLEKKRLRDREVQLFEQLQENYRRLREAEALRDDLTQMLVHDLRTPLTSLLTGLQTLCVSHLDETDQELLRMAIQGGHTLLRMINDVLDIHHMEAGSLALEREKLEAKLLIDSAVQQVASLAAEKHQTLTKEIAPDLPAFYGDEEKLRRTLINLLGNAIKFTPSGGRIAVSARREPEGSAMLFTVQDTGEGIPKEAFQRIFDKFGQVEERKAGRKMSTGLGLTFCKMVVEAHGGRIWVESELGQGSTFFVAIPISREDTNSA